MTDDDSRSEEDPQPPSAGGSRPASEEIHHAQISAIVPERVRRGVFSTGAVVLQGAHEFILDFLLRMTRPHQVAARVVLAPPVVARLIAALRENLKNYEKTFGGPPAQHSASDSAAAASPAQPAPASGQVPQEKGTTTISESSSTAQDLYDQLKLSDDVLSGTYANAVMIGHTATEFSFDFITTFFPRSAVASRVYLAAPNVPRFLDSLTHSFEQYQKKLRARGQQAPPENPDDPGHRPEVGPAGAK